MEELKVLAGDAGNEAGDADAERNGQGKKLEEETRDLVERDDGLVKLHPHLFSYRKLTTMETLTSTETLMITETTKTTDRIYNDIDL